MDLSMESVNSPPIGVSPSGRWLRSSMTMGGGSRNLNSQPHSTQQSPFTPRNGAPHPHTHHSAGIGTLL
ncbi:MAG: hypothetical protein RIQ40_658 [Planctomycetota bacterium]